jgi:eukaryotic-like serine/threonine-protein kinase
LRLNRYSEASKVSEDELRRGVGSFFFRMNIYSIAFINGDAATMERQAEAIGTEPDAHRALEWQADVSAFRGQFEKSKDFSRRAVLQSAADNVKGQDVLHRAMAAFRGAVLERCMEALDGSPREMVDLNQDALEYFAAAFALCGDVGRAKIAIDAMFNWFPNDTLVKVIALPEARAALALHRLKTQDAIDALEPVRRYEAAAQFRPQYLRGLAYLQLKSPRQAAAEFQRILDHRGQAPLSVLYPLAQLGLARSLVLDGNTAKGRRAYEELFALWKDAEPELIPLRAARREYEQLESR